MKKKTNKALTNKTTAVAICALLLVMVGVIMVLFSQANTLKENELDRSNMYAILLDNNGTMVETDEFPDASNYEFNATKSGCVDMDNNTIENALSYNNGEVEIATTSTAYCYLVFSQIS